MEDPGDVTARRVEIEWEGALWEVDVEVPEGGGPVYRMSLWRTKANGSREKIQAVEPPEEPLSLEVVHGWLTASEVPDPLTWPLAERILEARSGQ